MKADLERSVNVEIGRILAGLEYADRLTVFDFLRQEFGVEAYVDVRKKADALFKGLAVDFKRMIERDWYIQSKARQDIETVIRDISNKAFDAKRVGDVQHYKLVADIREEAKFRRIVEARIALEHEEKMGDGPAEWKRERRARRDDVEEGYAAHLMRKRFMEHLKMMKAALYGDEGYGLGMSTLLAMGDLEGAKRFYKSIPMDIRDANPMWSSGLILLEAMLPKKKPEAAPFTVLGVSRGTTVQAPSPFN